MSKIKSFKYNAFMSYSHAADGKLAPALQSALHQFAKPWYRLRAMRVFRDKTSLAITPELWPSIQEALAESEYFILLASPQAAQSPWVQKEVDWWLQERTAQTLFIVLTEGEADWDSTSGDFNWTKTTAIPANLQGKFKNEPLYVNLRWAKAVDSLSLRNSQFRSAVLDVSAALLRRDKDELDGEDVQQHRRFKAIVSAFGSVLIAGITWSIFQTREMGHTNSHTLSTAAQSASDAGHVDRALRFAVLAAKNTWLSPSSVEAEPQLARVAHASALQISLSHESPVRSAAFTTDGTNVLTASDDQAVRVWDVATGKQLAKFPHVTLLDDTLPAAFTTDGTKVLTAPNDRTVRVWDIATGKELRRITHEGVWRAAFTADGTKILTASNDRTVRVWDIAMGKELAQFTYQGVGDQGTVWSVAFTTDGTKILTTSDHQTARVWDVATGKELARFVHEGIVWSAAFTTDNTKVLTASSDQTARVWDVLTGKELVRFAHEGIVWSAAFTTDSTKVLTASFDKTARVWDVATGQELMRFAHKDNVRSATFSPDGTKVITASYDQTARVWDVATGKDLVRFAHEGVVRSATFSTDGTKVVTASADQTVRVWDMATGKELARFAHEGAVPSATFTTDKTEVVTASWDKTARVWDVATGKELARFSHEGIVASAVLSPSGTNVVTASYDKTARVSDIYWLTQYHGSELVERVCQKKLIGSHRLTKQDIEISSFLSGREGEDVCDSPSWFSILTRSLGFGPKATDNPN